MIRAERAVELVRKLSEIEQELERLRGNVDIEKLDELIGEVRDAVWHEVPVVLSTLMDQEEGIFRTIESPRN